MPVEDTIAHKGDPLCLKSRDSSWPTPRAADDRKVEGEFLANHFIGESSRAEWHT